MTPALKSRTLSAAIGDDLRQGILSGRYPAGEQLRQDALAAQYAVSRIPVREALFALEAEGLVQILPHRGAVVTRLSAEEVCDVFDLRSLLEPRLLVQSIPLLQPQDFAVLDRIQLQFAEAIARQDRARWGLLNAELHLTMYRRAPLPRSLAIVTGLLQTSERYTRLQMTSAIAYARAEREHAELIAFCRSGAVDAAAELLGAHIAQVRQDIEALMARG